MEHPCTMNDVSQFWTEKLEHLRNVDAKVTVVEKEKVLPHTIVYDVCFSSIQDGLIRGYLLQPVDAISVPCVIEQQGYMVTISSLYQYMHWILEGYAVFVYDNRMQGGRSTDGKYTSYPSGNQPIAFGLMDAHDYYQGRLYCDAVRAIDIVASLPQIDKTKIILNGASQGGALVLASAALTNQKLFHVFADVPSSSLIPSRIQEGSGSYRSITEFIKKYPSTETQVLSVQKNFDLINLVASILAPVTVSVGGKDDVCPARLFQPVYDKITSEKKLYIYPYNGHEGGHHEYLALKLKILRARLNEQ